VVLDSFNSEMMFLFLGQNAILPKPPIPCGRLLSNFETGILTLDRIEKTSILRPTVLCIFPDSTGFVNDDKVPENSNS